jgi:hypothetical protein
MHVCLEGWHVLDFDFLDLEHLSVLLSSQRAMRKYNL